MVVLALVLLAALSLLSVGLYKELPPAQVKRHRARLAVGTAVLLLGGSGAIALHEGPVQGWTAELAGALAVLAGTVTGGAVAPALLRLAEPSGTARARGPADPTLLHGGAWIGVLERLAISSTVLLGWPEGIAVVLAIKGLGRYPELRAAGAAERFIIGTLGSVLWATACAGVGWALLH